MKKTLEIAKNITEELLAVETLEYLNKNWLFHGTNLGQHSLRKQERMEELLGLLNNYIQNMSL